MDSRKRQILIVEDEAAIAMLLEQLLLSAGYDVCGIVMTGHEAIEKARRLSPDMILMDIMINGVMNGIEAARTINSTIDVPIIFLTAYTDVDTRKKADTVEHSGFVQKPFKAHVLLSVIKKAFDELLKEKTLDARLNVSIP